VASITRLLKIIGLFCKISSLFKGSFAKETYNFKEPTSRSHPIPPIALGVSLNANLQSQSQKEPYKRDDILHKRDLQF